MSDRSYMHDGSLYDCSDPELMAEQRERMEMMHDFNHARPGEEELRQELLRKMFAEVGEGVYIEPPMHASWCGKFCHLGNNVYVNFNLTLVDDTHIFIGDGTKIGPNVTLVTAGHPLSPELRAQGLQFNKPVRIGRNCWLGAGVTVLPGVTIGDGSTIGAGSVVTRDIPAGVVAYGVPCRVVKELG